MARLEPAILRRSRVPNPVRLPVSPRRHKVVAPGRQVPLPRIITCRPDLFVSARHAVSPNRGVLFVINIFIVEIPLELLPAVKSWVSSDCLDEFNNLTSFFHRSKCSR